MRIVLILSIVTLFGIGCKGSRATTNSNNNDNETNAGTASTPSEAPMIIDASTVSPEVIQLQAAPQATPAKTDIKGYKYENTEKADPPKE